MNNFPEIPKNLFGKSTQQFALSDPNNVDASKSSLSNTQAMEQLKAFEQGMSFDADLQSKVNASKPQNPTNGRRKVNSIIQTPNMKSNLPSIDEESYNNKNQNENFLLSRERNHDFMDMNETNQVLMFETINELILKLDKQIALMQSYIGSLNSLIPIDESLNTMLQLLQQIRSLEDKAIQNANNKKKFSQKLQFTSETHQLLYPIINSNIQNSNQFLFKIKEAQLQKYDKQTVIFRLRDSIDDKQVIGKTVLRKDIPKLNLLADDKSEGKYSIEFDLSKMNGTNASVNINWEQLYPVNKIKNLNAGQSQSNDAQQINQFSVDLLQKKTKDSYEVIATGTFDLNQLIGSDSCILEVLLQDSTDKVSDKIVESSFLPLEPLSVKVELQIAHPLSGFKIQDNNLNFIIVQDVNEELIDILNRMKDQIFKLNQLQKVSIAHPSQQSIIQLIPNLTQPKQQQQQQNILQSQQQTFAVPPKISKSSNSGQYNQQQNPSQQITTLNHSLPLTRLTRNRSLSPQGASSDQNKTVDSVPAPSQINSQEKDKLTHKELKTTQGLNSSQNGQLKTSQVQPKSMPKPPQPDQIQSQSDPNEFDPLVCQSEFEFEGQDFAEIEKVIPIDKLYPSNVLYREIDAVDKVKYLISRDKNNANKYENVQLLDARRAQADALANKIGEDFKSETLNNDIYKQKIKEMQDQFKKKLLTQTSKKASNDQEKRRNEGLKHHIRGIILHLKDEIENAGVESQPKQWGRAQNPVEAQKTSALQSFQTQKQVLELQKNHVKNCIIARRQRAVAYNRNNEADNAATEIRRAHLNKKQFDTLSGMIEQLDILENNIQMANTTKIYAQALDEGAAQFKAIIGDLTPEKIQAKVDAVQDMQSNLEEINRVIQGATNIGIDDDDIQAELAFLTAQAEEEERNPKAQQTQKQFAIPKVPTREIYISQPQLESDAQFEAQLAALTEGM